MNTVDYDEDTKFLGEWGPFQKRIMLLLCISVIPNGLSTFSIVFLADTPSHHCAIPPNANISAEWRNYSIPLEENKGVMRYGKCTRYKLDVIQRLSDNGSVPGIDVNVSEIEQESCKNGWEYDRSIYISTIVSENVLSLQWDLVCNDAWKVPMTSSVYFLGLMVGSIISGQLSDRFGRKIQLFTTIGVQTLFMFFQIFSTSWFMFSAFHFFIGMGAISNYMAAFVLGTEILSTRIRIIFSTVGVCIFFAIGYMLLPLMAFFIRDWRMLLIAINVSGVFHFFLWWFIPESPRWLLSQGRVEEAEAILRGAAKENGVTAPEVIFQPLQPHDGSLALVPMLTKAICPNSYGALKWGQGDLCIKDLSSVSIALEMMGKFGVTVAFSILYPYTAELYPTVLRNTAIGICSMASQLGAIAAPYFLYLGTYYKSLPYIIMGTLSVLGGLLGFLLPETYGLPLPETIDHMQTIQRCKSRQTSNHLSSDSAAINNVSML
ncbi:solute carrier family 22 member 4-like isoform X4 [Conger conger]|uniref:solute carrier family 22 member 4-like isoform X4 n=1 Tax=Conger conger TaxID=82655 RepID=UPI002A59BE25|nr:solute carrier family 22 member 4-like isoform X4 [Conger conger]